MSQSPESSIEQLRANPNNPELVADMQASLGQEWGASYGDPSVEMDSSAEIILRNPSVYLHDVKPRQLPEDLEQRWEKVLDFADLVATQASTEPHDWGNATNPVSGLEKIHSLVRDGEVEESYRGSVADIMRSSSALFAESTKHVPGNTQYYAGNAIASASWLDK